MSDRFQRYNERARKALSLAQEEAQRFQHNYIGTEHILLGLVREGNSVAGLILRGMGVELYKVRTAVENIPKKGATTPQRETGLTPRAKKVVELAFDEANRLQHPFIGTGHLLLGMARVGEGIGVEILHSLGVELEKMRQHVLRVLSSETYSPNANPMEEVPVGAFLRWADLVALEPGGSAPLHQEQSEIPLQEWRKMEQQGAAPYWQGQATVSNVSVDLHDLAQALDDVRKEKEAALAAQDFGKATELKEREDHMKAILEKKAAETQTEKQAQGGAGGAGGLFMTIGKSLLEKARAGNLDPLIGRERELENLLRTLGRRKEAHVMLVGEGGVGKTALVHGLAQHVTEGDIEINDIILMKQSEFAEFIQNPGRLLKQSESETKPTVLCVAQFEHLVEFADKVSRLSSIYDLLNHPAYRLLASTTPQGYDYIKQTDPILARRFQVITVNEPDEVAILQILRGVKLGYEQYHKVWIDDSALEMAVLLSEKYMSERKQPSKALDLLDEACSMVAMRRNANAETAELNQEEPTEEVIEEIITRSPVTAFEVTEVVAAITGKTVEEIEKELDAEE